MGASWQLGCPSPLHTLTLSTLHIPHFLPLPAQVRVLEADVRRKEGQMAQSEEELRQARAR